MITNTSQAKVPVYAVVISEKGGAERREAFEQAELSIGRVQGNDLMLPKGNVSKRHARLMYRDARFIVTDLNSTNGTYVNRRRINQATIVREGDRIYIGDFVLRVEVPAEEGSGTSQRPSSPGLGPRAVPSPTTGPEISNVSQSPAREAESTGNFPAVPPAPRLPQATVADSNPSNPATISAVPSSGPRAAVDRAPLREDSVSTETVSYRSAVAALIDRVSEQVGAALLEADVNPGVATRVERAIDEQLLDLKGEGIIGAALVDERLRRDARAELLELGPLGPLLEDETVSEIAVTGIHGITAIRGGQRTAIEPPISSETSLQRILGRLCRRSDGNQATEGPAIRCTLDGGLQMQALAGDAVSGGALIRIERPQRVDATLEDLVRSGAVSRAVATFLKQCVAGSSNILVIGAREARTAAVLCALAAANPDRHALILRDREMFVSSKIGVSHLDLSEPTLSLDSVVELAANMPSTRLVVCRFAKAAALAALDAINAGADGVLSALYAPTIRRGLARLPVELAAARPGLNPDVVRQWIAASFDLIVEVATLRDGRHRVLRVCEPTGVAGDELRTQDIFTFVVERTATGGSIEGTFHASGVLPKIVDDLAARGIVVDPALFNRTK